MKSGQLTTYCDFLRYYKFDFPRRGEVFALGRIGEIVTYVREAVSLTYFSPVI